MIIMSLVFGLYFSSVLMFAFVSQPIYVCIILLISSLSSCFIINWVCGFSWYIILFCLVYVGGIYILFVFVSVYSPNTVVGSSIGWRCFLFFYVVFTLVFSECLANYWDVYVEFSNYLCSNFEGYSYLILCIVLILGFTCVSVIVNRKDSFFR